MKKLQNTEHIHTPVIFIFYRAQDVIDKSNAKHLPENLNILRQAERLIFVKLVEVFLSLTSLKFRLQQLLVNQFNLHKHDEQRQFRKGFYLKQVYVQRTKPFSASGSV
jgi:hypothetical protein